MELYSLPSFSSRGYDYEGSLGSRNPGFYGGSKIVSSSRFGNLIYNSSPSGRVRMKFLPHVMEKFIPQVMEKNILTSRDG